MTRLPWIARYLLVLPIVPPALLSGFAVLTIAGAAAIIANPSNPEPGTRVLEPILLLQLFATSSGFRVPACRGHYDLLLASGAHRLLIGAMHWLLSALPGILSWLVVALTARACGSDALLRPAVLLTLLAASTLPWALSIPLPRMGGAIVCLVAVTLGITVDRFAAAAVVAIALTALAAGLLAIQHMDAPLDPGQT